MSRPEFESRLAESWPPDAWAGVTVLVAVSGGPDSVALARGLAAIGRRGPGSVTLAHFNHRLRGPDSDGDEAFCRDLARRLDWPCEIGRAAEAAKASDEQSCRDERYSFLCEAARRTGARYVATAHTADDQAETVLHRIVRGTGLAGLAGMPRARELADGVSLIRPMLSIRREDAHAYLAAIGQGFRTDESNRDLRFTRNRIRHDLLPRLSADYNAEVVEALLRLAAQAGEAQAAIDAIARELAARAVVSGRPDHVVLDCRQLAGQPRHLVRALLVNVWREQAWPQQAMGYSEWDRLAVLAAGQSDGRHVLPCAIEAARAGERLELTRRQPAPSPPASA
jgi:tRNA(Ile)-lysidine synthase